MITALGDKVEARRIAAHVGAPLVKGSDCPLASAADAVAFAREAGLPLAIKAALGGGGRGRGMKVARRLEEVGELFDSAVREATEAFGRGECYAEQLLDKPRHSRRRSSPTATATRWCWARATARSSAATRSLWRRRLPPSSRFISEDQRARIHDAARAICAEVGYTGAGTVEFLLSRDGVISFLEVNTRLPVEHPVTEETTGLDIVIEQWRIADGLPLSVRETPPRAAMPSSSGSMPRIPAAASCRHRPDHPLPPTVWARRPA